MIRSAVQVRREAQYTLAAPGGLAKTNNAPKGGPVATDYGQDKLSLLCVLLETCQSG